MATTARERLAKLLGGSESRGSFSAELTAPADLLQLEVTGVGPVRLPLRAPLAKKLIAPARPAMFGQGTKTLRDTDVRDTWELTPDQRPYTLVLTKTNALFTREKKARQQAVTDLAGLTSTQGS